MFYKLYFILANKGVRNAQNWDVQVLKWIWSFTKLRPYKILDNLVHYNLHTQRRVWLMIVNYSSEKELFHMNFSNWMHESEWEWDISYNFQEPCTPIQKSRGMMDGTIIWRTLTGDQLASINYVDFYFIPKI